MANKPTDIGLLLQLLERAKGLGLEIELTRATRTTRFQTLDNGNISGVWANCYDIVSWSMPRGTKNNQGHQMMKVFTRRAAEGIAELWAKHTFDANNYYTINKVSTVFGIRELKRFIALREEEELRKPAMPKLLPSQEQLDNLATIFTRKEPPAPHTEDVDHEEVNNIPSPAYDDPAPPDATAFVAKRKGRPPGSRNAPAPVKKAATRKTTVKHVKGGKR